MPTPIKPEEKKTRLFLFYGPTGAGKSWLAASGESRLGGRTLIVMTEAAETGLTGFDVDVLAVQNMEQFHEVLRNLKANNGSYKNDAGELQGPYATMVVDSMSQMQKFGLAVDSDAQYKLGNVKTALNIPLDSYKRVGEDIRRCIWMARTLPLNTVMICLDRVFTSEDNTVRMVGPNLTESLSGDVRAYADVVGYMTAAVVDTIDGKGVTARKLVRRLFLQPGKDFYARVRAGKGIEVPEYIVSPTLEKVLDVFKHEDGLTPGTALITPAMRAAHERAEAITGGKK